MIRTAGQTRQFNCTTQNAAGANSCGALYLLGGVWLARTRRVTDHIPTSDSLNILSRLSSMDEWT